MHWFSRTRTYAVTADRDEWAAPEETLIDSSSAIGTVELPVGDGIFRGALLVAAGFAFVLVMAVANASVVHYGDYTQLSIRNRTVSVAVPPPRGAILDRAGVPLVQNQPSFDLLAVSRQIRRSLDGTFPDIAVLARVVERNPEELTLELTEQMKKNAVFFLATDLSRDRVLQIANDLPTGFSIITSTKRKYLDGPQFSHLLGYVGKVTKQDMARDPYYLPSDTVGRQGIEAQYEDLLRGVHGRLNFDGSEAASTAASEAGDNLVLTVDAAAQKMLWNSIFGVLRESGLGEAAAVVQDPRDGSVLAMVSFPSYDNNIFTGLLSQEDVDRLFNSRQRPLFNRAISGRYNPGSTIKPFIGMTALQEGTITSESLVTHDCIALTIPNPSDPSRPYVFENWRRDMGWFTLRRAIADSCNVYFYMVGGGYGAQQGLGIERIDTYLKSASADTLLGIDLPGEESGFIPTPEWKRAVKKEPWYQGDTYNVSIGQGDLLVTPLWLNSAVAAIANGGTIWQPRVGMRVVDDQMQTIRKIEPVTTGKLPFSPNVIAQMQTAMRATVTEGTARILADLPVSAAAKTGTAEVIKGQRINSLLTVYAPADNPQIAMTVLVEGSASNQGLALRVAKQFLQWYFMRGKTTPTPTPLPVPDVSAIPEPSLAPVASTSEI